MEFEEKLKWLKSYRGSMEEMQDVSERIIWMRAQAERMSAQLQAVPVGGAAGDRLQECVAKICELEETYAAIACKNVKLLLEMEDVISKLEDAEQRTLIRRKYIDDDSFNALADEMHYSLRHLKRKVKAAIQNLSVA